MATHPRLSVSDFVALTNQTLEYAYPMIEVEGEVSGFKVNQGKFVFFDIKDAGASVGCFMMAFALRVPIEDGMKVLVTATPKLTQWGKFSLTIKAIRPSGEGSLKKSFELLKAKLDDEGLFAPERKRAIPAVPTNIAVISSTQAAGYADFIKIINDRWGGVVVDVAHVQVQGDAAPDQIIRALKYFNGRETVPDVIAIIRGGGSADDLSAFNDELLVREIAASRVPTVVGVGHETDESLADLAADVRAATPSNAAQLIVPDRHEMIRSVQARVRSLMPRIERAITQVRHLLRNDVARAIAATDMRVSRAIDHVRQTRRLIAEYDPQKVLDRGYALLRGQVRLGQAIEIETKRDIITAEVTNVTTK